MPSELRKTSELGGYINYDLVILGNRLRNSITDFLVRLLHCNQNPARMAGDPRYERRPADVQHVLLPNTSEAVAFWLKKSHAKATRKREPRNIKFHSPEN